MDRKEQMKIIESHAATPLSTNSPAAVIHFDRGYYWGIPANHHDAVKIAELAEDLAGVELDGIVFFGDCQEMAILTEDRGRRSIATSFGAAFMANKFTRG
jgi:hypothetical protein